MTADTLTTLDTYETGAAFGELELLYPKPRTTTVVATRMCVLCSRLAVVGHNHCGCNRQSHFVVSEFERRICHCDLYCVA